MPAITSTDLNNAKLDLDHIAAIATSVSDSATDRLGNIKNTMVGAVNTIKAFNSRGVWTGLTTYAVKDLVSNTNSSVTTWYVCVVGHTSSAAFATDTSSKWRVYQGITSGDISVSSGSSLVGHLAQNPGAIPVTVKDELLRIAGKVYYNVNSSLLSKWVAAIARSRCGNGTARVACIGDSTSSGVGSNPSSATSDSRRRAYPAALATSLSQMSISAQSNSIFCDGFEGSNITTFDPRLTLDTGWSIHPTMFSIGGKVFYDPSTTSPKMSFNPGVSTDTIDVYCVRYPGYADVVISTSGTFNGSGTTAGSSGIVKVTATRTASTSAWDIQKSTLTPSVNLLVVGVDAYLSTDTPISVWNMGASGSKVNDWVSDNQPYNFEAAIKVLSPDLSLVNLTINDWSALTTPANYKSDLQKIITACLVTGDVILLVGVPSNIGNATVDEQLEYSGYVYELARTNNLPVINLSERWVSQAYQPDRNFYYDGLHPSNAGYNDIANAIARAIANI